MAGCSPPAWGWSADLIVSAEQLEVLPTRVGMVRHPVKTGRHSSGAPHPRGDGPAQDSAGNRSGMCSPPAWGWSGRQHEPHYWWVVLPTRVGMVRLRNPNVAIAERAPHPRGDGPHLAGSQPSPAECSPPAWGWSATIGAVTTKAKVLPTRVGMVRTASLGSAGCQSAPHPRGDGPIIAATEALALSCSPPAWGWSAPA